MKYLNDNEIPRELLDGMVKDFPFREMESFLVPYAGTNALAEILRDRFYESVYRRPSDDKSSLDVDTTENSSNASAELKRKGFKVVHDEFLTMDSCKQYDAIVLVENSGRGLEQLMQALRIQMLYGGRVVCLIHVQHLSGHSPQSHQLVVLLQHYEAVFEYYTIDSGTEMVLVNVTVPPPKRKSVIFSSMEEADEQEEVHWKNDALAETEFFKSIVDRFKLEARAGIGLIQEFYAIAPIFLTSFEDYNSSRARSTYFLNLEFANSYHSETPLTVNNYLRKLRYKYWKALLANKRFVSRMTSNVREEYNAKMDDLADYDFTLYNIHVIQCEISDQLARGMEETILKMFDSFCEKHRNFPEVEKSMHNYQGWKSNSCYKVNSKAIIVLRSWTRFNSYWPNTGDASKFIVDLHKVFAYLDAAAVDEDAVRNILQDAQQNQQEKNLVFRYFTINFYKKGTAHIIFTDERLLKVFNVFAAQRRNWLPPTYGKVSYSEMTPDEQKVIDVFEGKVGYEQTMQAPEKYIIPDTLRFPALMPSVDDGVAEL